MKKHNDKNANPKNCYQIGSSWIVEFMFRGQRYWENIGPVARGVAKQRAENRKADVAAGRRAVNGKKWNDSRLEWIPIEPEIKIEDPLFEVAMERFLEFYRTECAEYTYTKYALPCSKTLCAFFSGKRLSQISLVTIESFKRDRRTGCDCVKPVLNEESNRCQTCKHFLKAKSVATINRELTLLRHFFNKSIDFRLAKHNPFRIVTNGRVERVKLYKETGRERYLNREEAQRLLDACNSDLRPVVLAAMHLGFRSSELKALTWSNVDLVKGFATCASRYAKNGETRTVPLSNDLSLTLQRLKEKREPRADDLVFPSPRDKKKRWVCWKEAFNAAVKRAGLRDFRFHDLRHTFASHLGMNGTNQKAMMQLMGHRDPQMTLRYTHLSVEYNRAAIDKLPRFSVLEEKSQQISQRESEERVLAFAK